MNIDALQRGISFDDFEALYGVAPTHRASAPGRVNLIGDHTDYHGGHVLPTVISHRTHVQLRLRDDSIVRVFSENQPADREPLEYRLGDERAGRGWLDYVQGVTFTLQRHPLCGFDLAIASNVPVGAGLSSSAALEVALLRGLRAAFELDLSDFALAILARQAENDFVGVPTGVMDQLASSLATPGTALLIDTHNLDFQALPLPEDLALIVFGSGVQHRLADGQYAQRRAESEDAARRLGVRELRELGVNDLERIARLPRPLSGRARHVVSENDRVVRAAEALSTGAYEQLGRLMLESHASLRDDYEVSIEELDRLVELAVEHGALGARMTGAGFGGCIVALAPRDRSQRLQEDVLNAYARTDGPSGFSFEVEGGARPDSPGEPSPEEG